MPQRHATPSTLAGAAHVPVVRHDAGRRVSLPTTRWRLTDQSCVSPATYRSSRGEASQPSVAPAFVSTLARSWIAGASSCRASWRASCAAARRPVRIACVSCPSRSHRRTRWRRLWRRLATRARRCRCLKPSWRCCSGRSDGQGRPGARGRRVEASRSTRGSSLDARLVDRRGHHHSSRLPVRPRRGRRCWTVVC
jgi:hypothetical protein